MFACDCIRFLELWVWRDDAVHVVMESGTHRASRAITATNGLDSVPSMIWLPVDLLQRSAATRSVKATQLPKARYLQHLQRPIPSVRLFARSFLASATVVDDDANARSPPAPMQRAGQFGGEHFIFPDRRRRRGVKKKVSHRSRHPASRSRGNSRCGREVLPRIPGAWRRRRVWRDLWRL